MAVFAFLTGCRITHQLDLPKPDDRAITGNGFYKLTGAMKWNEREPLMMKEILAGNIPAFLKKLVPVHVVILDSLSGKMIRATYFVTPDYLSIGNDKDFARVPMTPMTAQAIAEAVVASGADAAFLVPV